MKIGFIGAGNMSTAIVLGLLKNGWAPENIFISRKHPERKAEWAEKGVEVLPSNEALVKTADCVVLAVKPHQADAILREVGGALKNKLVVSIMAGWPYDRLEKALPATTGFVRAMPNTPLMASEGMTLIGRHARCSEQDFEFAKSIFAGAGRVAEVEDEVFNAANGISGCGPAFVYAFIEALADGGVRYGVPRALAYELAAQTVIGAGRMVQETGRHPGSLKDAVCSPGGATIEGIFALERGGMRAAVIDAVGQTVIKTQIMESK